ncbi:hypothetical protein GCM10023238_36940 [Streptomyces heliomycini]
MPSSFPGTAERIATYNAAIPGVVEARRAAGKNVWLVDMDAVTTADLADGCTPTTAATRRWRERSTTDS